VEELRRAIRVTRKLGFGLNEQESEIGLSAIAMLVVDHNDPHVVLGAVSIAGLSFKLDRSRLLSFVEPLRMAVQQISLLWPVRAYQARDTA
jgi:DNA-binding IclR family transcriptional regulator